MLASNSARGGWVGGMGKSAAEQVLAGKTILLDKDRSQGLGEPQLELVGSATRASWSKNQPGGFFAASQQALEAVVSSTTECKSGLQPWGSASGAGLRVAPTTGGNSV